MSDTPKPPEKPLDVKKDPMADRAPAHVLSERDESKGPKIEVTQSYADGISAGIGDHGMMLDDRLYVSPDERDPSVDFRFCTLDGRRVARNRAKGWTPFKKKDGRDVLVGQMQLCTRPKQIGTALKQDLAARSLAQARRYKADEIAASTPGLLGREIARKL